MATMQKLPPPSASTGSSYGSCRAVVSDGAAVPANFPAGLRVLVVDDDVTCLKILEHMLRKCSYRVTACSQAMTALSLLREKKSGFDVVISDVHMPDMDGFKLLELVGLEMDLPVIMMSADGRTSAVMRGIKHGACDYLIKPVRIEELKNVWQHVVRKKWNENKDVENSGSFEDSNRQIRETDETEYASSVNERTVGLWKTEKKRKDSNVEEDDGELDNEDSSASKKPRVVWSVELHQQFVNAVNQLGIEKAVPKRILELMNVPGLTRENVASHLQKFRLYLKRISAVTRHQSALTSLFCNHVEANTKVDPSGRLDLQSLVTSGQIHPHTLATLHEEFLDYSSGNIVFPKFLPLEKEVAFCQPLFKCQSGTSKQLSLSVQDMSSGYSTWPTNQLDVACSTNKPGLSSFQSNNLLMQMLQHQPQQELHQESFIPVAMDLHNATINGENSLVPMNRKSVVLSPQPSSTIQIGNNPVLTTSNSTLNSSNVSYGDLSSCLKNPLLGMVQVSDEDFKNIDLLSNYSHSTSISTSVASRLVCNNSSPGWRSQNSNMKISSINRMSGQLPNLFVLGSELKSGTSDSHGYVRNHGFVGKNACLPSRFVIDDVESPTTDQIFAITSMFDGVNKVKQETNFDFTSGSKVESTVLPNSSL